jgi:hypothetical protein
MIISQYTMRTCATSAVSISSISYFVCLSECVGPVCFISSCSVFVFEFSDLHVDRCTMPVARKFRYHLDNTEAKDTPNGARTHDLGFIRPTL